jgi:hypothetical protein
LELKVKCTIDTEEKAVYNALEQREFQKWKKEEIQRWKDERLANAKYWRVQLQDFIEGTLKFDKLVQEYILQIQLEISDVKWTHFALDSPEREEIMKKHFEELFESILKEAAIKHPPLAERVEEMIGETYRGHPLVGQQFNFQEETKPFQSIVWITTNPVIQPSKIAEEKLQVLIPLVQSTLQNTKQYSKHLVEDFISLTRDRTDGETRAVQYDIHKLVKALLVEKLTVIQGEWDLHYNVAKRLKTQRAHLWLSFLNHANKVDGTKMLSMALTNLLGAHELLDGFMAPLAKAVSGNLQSREEWVCNWKVMRAHLDLHLVELIKSKEIQEVLRLLSDGAMHYKLVVNKFIKKEIDGLLADSGDWTQFKGLICNAMKKAAFEASNSESGTSKPLIFQQSIIKSLDKLSRDLARGVSVTLSAEACSIYSNDIDFMQISEDVSASVSGVQLDMTNSIEEVMGMVRNRLVNSNTDSVRARCDVMCPHCKLTCFKAANHLGLHNTLHQPQGLCGWCNRYSKKLFYPSCSKSVMLDQSFYWGHGDSEVIVPYKEWATIHPEWMLPAEESGTVEVREFIFAHFQKELLEKYKNCKACSEIPIEYQQHSLETLQLNLENIIRSK